MRQPDYDGNRDIEPHEIRFSVIIAWVLENRDSYPLPPEAKWSHVYYDIPESMTTENHTHWINVSKTQFAEANAVAPSQVSRWIAAGMMVRDDGRIEFGPSMDWLERYRRTNQYRKEHGWKI